MLMEIRSDSVHIEGYVNAVERDSNVINVPSVGQCVEQIRAGAFEQSLRDGEDVALLENHSTDRKLGSISEGNLKLYEDKIGLRAEADIYDSDVIDKAVRGLIKGWSFGFICKGEKIENRAEGVPRRIVNALNLKEVSLIDGNMSPCYAGTLVEVRGQEMIERRAVVDEEVDIIDSRAKPDYSYYDAVLQLLELRYNPYHDPSNGKFTSGGGGGGGEYLFVVPKGQKGKGILMYDKGFDDKDKANAYYNFVYYTSNINGTTPTGLNPNPNQKKVANGANLNTTATPTDSVGEKFGVTGGAGTAYTLVRINGENIAVRNDYLLKQADGSLIISEKSLANPRKSGIIDYTEAKKQITESSHSMFPDTIAGVSRGAPMTFDEADNGKANPSAMVKETYGNTHNCQSVAVVMSARERGYNVVARAKNKSNTIQTMLSYDSTIAYIDPATGRKPTMTKTNKNTVYNDMNSAFAPGQKGVVEFRHSSGGHIVNVEKGLDGELFVHDDQTKKYGVLPRTYRGEKAISSYFQNTHGIAFLRTDNLELNEVVVNAVCKPAKKE